MRGKHLNIYNIGTDERVTIIKLLNYIKKITAKSFLISTGPLKKVEHLTDVPILKK